MTNTATKNRLFDELEKFYSEPVSLTVVKDKSKHKDDLTVTVNGINYQIKRGVPVVVPRCVALAVERGSKQDEAADRYIESLKEE